MAAGRYRSHRIYPRNREASRWKDYPLSSRYRDDPRKNRSPNRRTVLDRDHTSSGSGSDEPKPRRGFHSITHQIRSVITIQNRAPVKSENKETVLSPSKKRKFSPIVWDQTKRPDADSNKTGKEVSVSKTLAPLEPPIEQHPIDQDANILVNSLQDPHMDDSCKEPGEIVEDEDVYPAVRKISSSRWAENNEEFEELEVVDPRKKKRYSTKKMPTQPRKRSINMLQACRSVDEFERLNKISEGTYGVVYRARDKKTGEVVAVKKVKMEREIEGYPMTSLREINILLSFHHPSIVDVKEVVMGSSMDSIFMVMEYMEHDLKGVMETLKQPYSQSEVKCLMLQLLEGVLYLHNNWVLHRDLKTSNLLLNNCGELKICDFGLARQYGSPLKPYTPLVVTLWYRAPELLLGAKEYSTAIDMWSVGCIMAELLAKKPLFNGRNEKEQLDKIFRTLGTPNENIWPGYNNLPGAKVVFTKQLHNRLREMFPPTSFTGQPTLSESGFDLLNKLLNYDPEKRITAEDALRHAWFSEAPLPKSKDFMPTFPARNDKDRNGRCRVMKSLKNDR